ncbi:MAG: class I adenylate-forming enzyme family protein [Acidimicrobiia bacterium]
MTVPFDSLVDTPGADLVGVVERQRWLGGTALSYSNRPPTIVDVLDRAVRLHPDRPLFTTAAGTVAVDAFAGLVEAAAARLTEEHGLSAGERFAVVAPNGLELAVALFAAARARLVMVGLNPRLAAEQWTYQLGHSGSRLALATEAFRAPLKAAASGTGAAVGGAEDIVGTVAAGAWRYRHSTDRPPEDAAFAIVYTSGTTGRPKGSLVVHRCSVHSGLSYRRVLQLTGQDVHGVVFPLSYISALHAHVLPALLDGSRCVLFPDPSPGVVAAVVAEQEISYLYCVPSLWAMLLRVTGFEGPALPLRLAASGGAPMPAPVLADLRAKVPQARLLEIYGLSETHSPATMLFDHEMRRHPGSVGRPLPCMEVEVVDDDGVAVATGDPGHLRVRGSLVTTGYFDDPGATAAAIDDAGWFATGDIGRVDGEGFVWVLDRAKDMINRGGHKVFSAEIERLLAEHPAVAEAAVFGIPERAGGEAVAVVAVLEAGAHLGVDEVRRYVSAGYAPYASPRLVRFVDALPRTTNGKVAKAELRERYGASRPGPG